MLFEVCLPYQSHLVGKMFKTFCRWFGDAAYQHGKKYVDLLNEEQEKELRLA